MLDELLVKNIALIEDASICFAPKLNVLTGETGAGKTALLSALKLICGHRASSDCVREGQTQACVQARFVFDQNNGEHLGAQLEANDEHHRANVDGKHSNTQLDQEDEFIISRRISAGGRSRCQINGEMASVSELAQKTQNIRIHSQHEQIALLQASTQLSYLDTYISADFSHLQDYHSARSSYLQIKSALEAAQNASQAAASELEFAQFCLAEINKIDPKAGEYEDLESQLPRLQNAQQLAQAVQEAHNALHKDGGVLDLLAEANFSLQRQAGIDTSLDELYERLIQLEEQAADIAHDLSSYAGTIECDPAHLTSTLERLEELSGLMKRFGPGIEQVFERRKSSQEIIENSDNSPERMKRLQKALDKAHKEYEQEAKKLATLRQKQAKKFCDELNALLADLAMADVSLQFVFQDLPFEDWSANGSQAIELCYLNSPTSAPKSISRIASGGELSRILLALECLYHERLGSTDDVLVFDEIDAGIGGKTANKVAACLEKLSKNAQVIVVTHLAQVAALADEHYVVQKHASKEELSSTTVTSVADEARVKEIARMLAGKTDDKALDHARSLLGSQSKSAI